MCTYYSTSLRNENIKISPYTLFPTSSICHCWKPTGASNTIFHASIGQQALGLGLHDYVSFLLLTAIQLFFQAKKDFLTTKEEKLVLKIPFKVGTRP